MMKITGLDIKRNIGKFDISDKARILYAGDYIFDVIAYDIDTDAVYSFGFNYADKVLYRIEYIDGDFVEGMIDPSKAINKLFKMVQSGLYEFDLIESDLIDNNNNNAINNIMKGGF